MITTIANQLKKFNDQHLILPIDKIELEEVIEQLFQLLFPVCKKLNGTQCHTDLELTYKLLEKNLINLIDNPTDILTDFFSKLPVLQQQLHEDAEAFYQNDPAAQSIEEIILSYPGFYALVIHRLSHVLYKHGVPIIPRLWSEYAHSKGGIDIHPGATIGKRFFLDHGTGTVIGETCVLGDDVKIYQNVTLGALHITKDLQATKRHPTVENNTVIYAGATILGGKTVIGHDSTIGGNVFITKSIEPFSLVYYNSEMKTKNTKNYIEPSDFII